MNRTPTQTAAMNDLLCPPSLTTSSPATDANRVSGESLSPRFLANYFHHHLLGCHRCYESVTDLNALKWSAALPSKTVDADERWSCEIRVLALLDDDVKHIKSPPQIDDPCKWIQYCPYLTTSSKNKLPLFDNFVKKQKIPHTDNHVNQTNTLPMPSLKHSSLSAHQLFYHPGSDWSVCRAVVA